MITFETHFELTASQRGGFVFTQTGAWPGSVALMHCLKGGVAMGVACKKEKKDAYLLYPFM